MADFATRLRELRKDRGLRQVDLARELGIAQTTVANYEQHTRFPDEEMLLRVVGFFDVSLDYLLGRTEISVTPDVAGLSVDMVRPDRASLSNVARKYLNLLLDGRRDEAFALIHATVRSGTTVTEIHRTVFTPALRVVGVLWESAEVHVSQEHFISEATESLMAELHPYLVRPRSTRGIVITAAAGGEQHAIGLRMVGDRLEEAGWQVHNLGTAIPAVEVSRAVARYQARVLAVSVTMSLHLDSAREMIRYVRSQNAGNNAQQLSIVAGGIPFALDPELYRRIGADGTALDPDRVVEVVDRLTGPSIQSGSRGIG